MGWEGSYKATGIFLYGFVINNNMWICHSGEWSGTIIIFGGGGISSFRVVATCCVDSRDAFLNSDTPYSLP